MSRVHTSVQQAGPVDGPVAVRGPAVHGSTTRIIDYDERNIWDQIPQRSARGDGDMGVVRAPQHLDLDPQ